jgi:hypothetical protein
MFLHSFTFQIRLADRLASCPFRNDFLIHSLFFGFRKLRDGLPCSTKEMSVFFLRISMESSFSLVLFTKVTTSILVFSIARLLYSVLMTVYTNVRTLSFQYHICLYIAPVVHLWYSTRYKSTSSVTQQFRGVQRYHRGCQPVNNTLH